MCAKPMSARTAGHRGVTAAATSYWKEHSRSPTATNAERGCPECFQRLKQAARESRLPRTDGPTLLSGDRTSYSLRLRRKDGRHSTMIRLQPPRHPIPEGLPPQGPTQPRRVSPQARSENRARASKTLTPQPLKPTLPRSSSTHRERKEEPKVPLLRSTRMRETEPISPA